MLFRHLQDSIDYIVCQNGVSTIVVCGFVRGRELFLQVCFQLETCWVLISYKSALNGELISGGN